jgi:hypothetical protein
MRLLIARDGHLVRMKRLASGVLVAMSALGLVACGGDDDVDEAVDEVTEEAEDLREDAEDLAGGVTARAAAEAMRGFIEADDLDPGQTARNITVLQNAAEQVPGSPTISGIEDTDGDGNDDDGKVLVAVGGQEACVTVEDNGELSVAGAAC